MRTNPIDLIGKTFGQLSVVEIVGKKNGKTVMACVCSCGTRTEATVGHIVQGRRVSCGCAKDGNPSHGKRYSREYSIWSDMIKRCSNRKSISYQWYGAKGIRVCEEWHDFSVFYSDMGDCPTGMSIDRIDPLKWYSKDNCRWATAKQQTENRTIQKLYHHEGRSMTLPSWCEELGINYSTMRNRLNRSKMSFEEAISYNGASGVKQVGFKEAA